MILGSTLLALKIMVDGTFTTLAWFHLGSKFNREGLNYKKLQLREFEDLNWS